MPSGTQDRTPFSRPVPGAVSPSTRQSRSRSPKCQNLENTGFLRTRKSVKHSTAPVRGLRAGDRLWFPRAPPAVFVFYVHVANRSDQLPPGGACLCQVKRPRPRAGSGVPFPGLRAPSDSHNLPSSEEIPELGSMALRPGRVSSTISHMCSACPHSTPGRRA